MALRPVGLVVTTLDTVASTVPATGRMMTVVSVPMVGLRSSQALQGPVPDSACSAIW